MESAPKSMDENGRYSSARWLRSDEVALPGDLEKGLREAQNDLPSKSRTRFIRPQLAHFNTSLFMSILPPDVDESDDYADQCFICLHRAGYTENEFKELALRLRREYAHSAFIFLRAPKQRQSSDQGFSWVTSMSDSYGEYLDVAKTVLTQIIRNGLIAQCSFSVGNIVFLGHRQGGTLALTIAALWNRVEFGGVVSIGGPIPYQIEHFNPVKAKTTAFILGGELGDMNANVIRRICDIFGYVDIHITPDEHDVIPNKADKMGPLLEFLSHRLRQEEWEKQAVISFDGGGIRGYGSLLILEDLMEKIGAEEKRLGAQSSFSPCMYKPTTIRHGEGNHDQETSLISIMLSRFRMSVDECISEYKTLGETVFGRPRRLSQGAIIRHKYDHRNLEKVVRDVTCKYNQKSDFEANFGPFPEDVCGTMVLAYADNPSAPLEPYIFRTYRRPAYASGKKVSKARKRPDRNHGDPSQLPITQVARATTAAPRYFKYVKIAKGNDAQGHTRFKDGGFGSNNPSEEAYQDVVAKHGLNSKVGPFVSIGTGIPDVKLFSEKKGHLHNTIAELRAVKGLPSTPQKTHEHMASLSFQNEEVVFPYYRFDGGDKLGKIALDEWKSLRSRWSLRKGAEPGVMTLDKIKTVTYAWLYQRYVQDDLKECAKVLVKRRRLRARNASKWDRYASYSHYECDEHGCTEHRHEADELKKHLREYHHATMSESELDERIKPCRRCDWTYDR